MYDAIRQEGNAMFRLRNTLVFLIVIVAFFVALLVGTVAPTQAQSENGEWTTPTNLSQSGAATTPKMLIGPNDTTQLIWQDAFSGYVTITGEGEQWSVPVTVTLPFTETTPLLLLDNSNHTHALWFDEDDALFYSRGMLAGLPDITAWLPPRQISEAALGMTLAQHSSGSLHMSYIRPIQTNGNPAGLYYRRSLDGGWTWTAPVLLYPSPYFRALTQDEANVQMALTESGRVFVAWDNPPLDSVFTIRSNDGGVTWEAPQTIDQRDADDALDATGPTRIQVSASAETVHLLWQAGHDGLSCTQYHQWSADGGDNWRPAEQLGAFEGCPEQSWLMAGADGVLVWLTSSPEGMALAAWNGTEWSEGVPQAMLSTFTRPDTFRPVTLGCHQPALKGDGRLVVVGCDTGNTPDIWLTTRALGEMADWFPPAPVWQPSAQIAESDAAIEEPDVVTDAEGRLHLFWSRENDDAIYYTRWADASWLQPAAILRSPTGTVHDLSVAVTPTGRLLVAWSENESGQVYFSQGEAEDAWIPGEWLEPLVLPTPPGVTHSPDVLVLDDTRISVAYTVPVNEGRGLYLIQSEDGGGSWSEPLLVFDGVAAGWTVVGAPRLATTGTDSLSLLWGQPSGLGSVGFLALHYAHSLDGGETWSAPEVVTEGEVIWSEVVGVGAQTPHRLWQESRDGRVTLWHQFSSDNGVTWSRATPIGDEGDLIQPIDVTLDRAGRLHLLRGMGLLLEHWIWSGRWEKGDSVALNAETISVANRVAAGMDADSSLTVVYAGPAVPVSAGQAQDGIFFTSRVLDLPAEAATPLPSVSPTPAPTPTATLLPVPSPTSRPVLPTAGVDEGTSARSGANGILTGVAVGALPTGLVVLGVVLLQAVRVRRNGG